MSTKSEALRKMYRVACGEIMKCSLFKTSTWTQCPPFCQEVKGVARELIRLSSVLTKVSGPSPPYGGKNENLLQVERPSGKWLIIDRARGEVLGEVGGRLPVIQAVPMSEITTVIPDNNNTYANSNSGELSYRILVANGSRWEDYHSYTNHGAWKEMGYLTMDNKKALLYKDGVLVARNFGGTNLKEKN